MNSQRILAVGGLLLFLASIAYGVLYDAFLLRERQYAMAYNLEMAVNMAAKGDIVMSRAFVERYAADSQQAAILARIPFHLAMAGFMAAIPLWLAQKLGISERMKRILALLLVVGGMAAAGGMYMQAAGRFNTGFLMLLGGYGWMALSLLGYLLYSLLFLRLYHEETAKRG